MVKKGQKLDEGEVTIEEEERRAKEKEEKQEEFADSLDALLEELKEKYKAVSDVQVASINQVATIT